MKHTIAAAVILASLAPVIPASAATPPTHGEYRSPTAHVLPQCGSPEARAMAIKAIQAAWPNMKVEDFQDFNPNTTQLMPETVNGIDQLEGMVPTTRANDEHEQGYNFPIIDTAQEKHCFAAIVANTGEAGIRYRLFLSSDKAATVDVQPIPNYWPVDLWQARRRN
jgi:hypothetical protein